MSSFLYALGRAAFRARWLVLAGWIVVLAILFAAAGALSQGTDNTYQIPGTESQDALDALARTFPQASNVSAQLIAVAPKGQSVRDPAFETAVHTAIGSIEVIPQVASAADPYASSSTSGISTDDDAVLVPVQLTVANSTAVTDSTKAALQRAGQDLQAALAHGSQVAVGGQVFSQTATGISITELLGIAVAFVVLLLTFLSVVAAGMPLLSALVGVAASLAVVMAATRFMTITSTTPLLALMLGLAVGIDYSLFIIARHQDQLKSGMDPEESTAQSVATSGSAVVFAAVTVMIALAGLAVAGIPFLTTMGLAAALAVAVAVLVATTLTPALLGFARWRVVPRRYRPDALAVADDAALAHHIEQEDADDLNVHDPDALPDTGDDTSDAEAAPAAVERPGGLFLRWVRVVTRVPVLTIVVIVVGLGILVIPAASLRLALPDAGTLEPGAPGRVTYDLVAEHFGPGYNGPLLVTGQIIQSSDPSGLMNDIGHEIAGMPGVASVPLATSNQTGDTGIVQVIPTGSPDSPQTTALVAELRAQHDHFEKKYGVSLSVTGYTAAGIDISDRLAGALVPFAILVVGLSLILLAMVFRSVIVPITAALGYLLSIIAAFGVTALIFENGFLAGPLNVHALGSVISFMPIILMGVLFGLAMDYEVFLVSRMREDYVAHGDADTAVEHGFTRSARVVTAAAVIMFAVFAAFIPEGDASIQPIAIGLAVGVAVDAFIVRMSLIPAILVLAGDWAWWMPAWLDRLLPSFDVEGEGLNTELAVRDWPDGEGAVALAGDGVAVVDPRHATVAEFDLRVASGDVLLVCGEPPATRSLVLLALSGRWRGATGRLKVAGLALPTRASAARSRVGLVRCARSDDPARDIERVLARRPRILALDELDAVRYPQTRTRVAALLADAVVAARARADTLTLIASCAQPEAVADLLPSAAPVHTIRLGSAQPSEVTLAVI